MRVALVHDWLTGMRGGEKVLLSLARLFPRATLHTLLHELTHAFVADLTRGLAPRDLHEGLAQYMEGKRCDSLLGDDGMRALADGRVPGVYGFYLGALSFVEYLIVHHGLSGINDLLKAMRDTGNLDQAFRQVYGQGYTETVKLWRARLKQEYGS